MPLMEENVRKNTQVSIIIPTFNESQNIIKILKSIADIIPSNIQTQTIVVDDNSPDGTGKIVEEYIQTIKKIAGYTIDVIHRTAEKGLGSAILKGIQHAKGDTIVVMDSDFSHPPQIILKMLDMLKKSHCDIVVASRYIKGGKILDWPLKRKLMSKFATIIAKRGLRVNAYDPMSGFFAFRRQIVKGLKFDAFGFKLLLEILVKTKGAVVKEIPYTFSDRKIGSSKVTFSTVLDYFKSVWRLYRYGKSVQEKEKRVSVKFLSKAGRFYTVGASGLGINYLMSFLFVAGIADLWYLHANVIGIIASMSSNFILNKIWTFEDREFTAKKTIEQYTRFIGFSSLGALVQLGMVFSLVEGQQISYPIALLLAVFIAAFGNFILNKKWTFKEKLWN